MRRDGFGADVGWVGNGAGRVVSSSSRSDICVVVVVGLVVVVV